MFSPGRIQGVSEGGGPKPEEGYIFKTQYWRYAATGGPNVKWGGTDFKWRSRAPPSLPLATDLVLS